jgi:hypothetical protein
MSIEFNCYGFAQWTENSETKPKKVKSNMWTKEIMGKMQSAVADLH